MGKAIVMMHNERKERGKRGKGVKNRGMRRSEGKTRR